MNKAVANPMSLARNNLLQRFVSAIRTSYWNHRSRNLTHRQLLLRTVSVIEDILQAHGLRESLYGYEYAEIVISTKSGAKLEIAKSPAENIVLSLQKDADFGQLIYSVVLGYEGQSIVRIDHMAIGFCINAEFQEKESRLLNPEVLVELLLSRSALKSGVRNEVMISNRKDPVRLETLRATSASEEAFGTIANQFSSLEYETEGSSKS